MGTVREGHEGEIGPIVVGSGVGAIFDSEPAFYLWTSTRVSGCDLVEGRKEVPCVMEAYH